MRHIACFVELAWSALLVRILPAKSRFGIRLVDNRVMVFLMAFLSFGDSANPSLAAQGVQRVPSRMQYADGQVAP